ncbi:alpha-hydroxy acid oxidase [Saccharopolyspora shandongensis]|uniref:alpha-hydroxy acid oxidase n=1 Tax=Saccharopolyspora shandongensis TaxID=418495 RepID=UPI0033F4516F
MAADLNQTTSDPPFDVWHSVEDAYWSAFRTLPKDRWDFITGAAGHEHTARANEHALAEIALLPRTLAGAADPDTSTTLLCSDTALPVAVAPMAYHQLAHPDGELATARAAKAAGVPFTVPTLSGHTVEELAAVGGECWFQLYPQPDKGIEAELIARAEAAGCTALMVTVDVPIMGRRLRDLRNDFRLPPEITNAHLPGEDTGGSAPTSHTTDVVDARFDWVGLGTIRDRTALPLVIKGVLSAVDADRAVSLGVDGVIVSNHGGRQLDGVPPAVAALPAVVDAVDGRVPVLFDSGIRSGIDILRALALGAQGVLVGRPVLWALAARGEPGVAELFSLLRTELASAMTIAGCRDIPTARSLRTTRTRR